MLNEATEHYADELDYASAIAMRETDEAVMRAREKAKTEQYKDPAPCGTCHYCGSDVKGGASFCSPVMLTLDELEDDYKPTKEEVLAGKALVDECRIQYIKDIEKAERQRKIGAHLDFYN
jgi:hypothetical protein